MENLTPPSVDSETQSQSFRREPGPPQQAYLIPAELIAEVVAGGRALVRGSVNLARWLTTTGAVIWILSRLQPGGSKALDIAAVVILLTLERRHSR
jgi:hypothetical protein